LHGLGPMRSAFLTLVSLFFVALFVLGVAAQLRTWRKQRAVRPWMIVLSQAAAFVSMVAFSVLTARPPGPLGWVLLLGLGGMFGLVYGRFVRVVRTGKGVRMSYALPWIVTWSVLMVLTQLNAVLFHRVPVVLYGFAIANLGLNLGMNASVLRAYRRAATVAAASLVLGAWALAGGTARAQTTEEQAIFDAVLMDSESDPVFLECRKVLGDLQLSPGREGWSDYERLIHNWPREARIENRKLSSPSVPRVYVGLRVLAFVEPGAAAQYVSSLTPPLSMLVRPECRRLVGGRFVIELVNPWLWTPGAERYRVPLLDILEAAANRAIDRPGAAAPPVAVPEDRPRDSDEPPAHDVKPAPAPEGPRPTDEGDGADEAPGTGAEGTPDERQGPHAVTPAGEDPLTPPEDETNPPLRPEDATAAVALSSLALLGGSLLQLLPGLLSSQPIGAAPPVPPPPPAPEPAVDPDQAYARQMEARGYRWSDRDGWVTDEQAREYQAQRDRAWQEHLKQDPELARIQGEIQKARDAQEAARAAQAEYDRKLQLMERQKELEREAAAARAELQQADWAGRAIDAVQMAADTAIGEIAEVTGPVGQAIRAGYNAAKGMATVVGEAIAEGRGLKSADIRRGLWLAVENAAMDMGMDAGVRKLTGQPGLFAEAADAAGDAAKQAARAAEAIADPKLAGKAEEMRKALATLEKTAKEGAPDTRAVLRLYLDGGMDDLAKLERLGHISKEEAAALNATLSQTVDRAVDKGTRETLDLWEKGNPGVRVKEVLVADSGSSAVKGKARSVLTDFDRTTVPVFDPDDVRQYAANRGITPAQAHQELTQQFKSIHEKAVEEALPGRLTRKDVDYKSYGGFGAKAGPDDSYPSGFATTRQATQGKTTVYPQGGGRPQATSREACVDQWDAEVATHGGPGPAEIGPRIAPQEFPAIAEEQVKAIVQKGDPKSVAKAVDRLAYMGQRSEVRVTGHAMDEGLVRLAEQVKKNPQDVRQVLEQAGVTEEEFAQRALEEARRLQGAVEGWNIPPGGG
jgi:hypothetical protein